MSYTSKSKEELSLELEELKSKYESLDANYQKDKAERKRVEEALKESEEKYKYLFMNNPVPLWVYDNVTLKFLAVNDFAIDHYGYSRDEFMNMTIRDIRPNEDIAYLNYVLTSNRDKTLRKEIQARHKKKDGTIIDVEITAHIIEFEGHSAMFVLIMDITDRKKIEDALKESEEIFNHFMVNSPIYIFFKDENIRPIRLSKNYEQMLGLPLDEILGKTMDELYPSDLAKQMIEDDKKVLIERNLVIVDEELNGRYYSTLKFPIIIDNKARFLAGYTIDITERKKVENELIEKNNFITTVLDNLPIGVALNKINEGDSFYINQKFEEIYGWSKDDMVNIVEFFKKVYPDEDYRNKLMDRVLSDIQSGDPSRMRWEDCVITQNDGSNRIVNAVNIPLFDQNTMVSTVMDVTHVKTTEMELIAAKEKAEESDRLKSAFLSNVSHEIRTPLNAILGFGGLINDSDLTPIERNDYYNIMKNRSNDLLNIVNDILDISKIEANQMVVFKSEGKISDLMNELFSSFQLKRESERNQKIKFTVKNDFPETKNNVITDFSRIKQVLNNLLNNAFKFTNQGSIEFGCRLTENDGILFYVSDTGIGIPENEQNKIFDRFRQVEQTISKQYGGTGLGLSISKGLVELLSGKIWVESKINNGSTFFVTIPYKSAQQKKIGIEKKEFGKIDLSDKTILIIEDDEFNLFYIEKVIQDLNCNVYSASDGQSASEIFKQNSDIDLVLMDIQLPDISGYELTKIFKETRKEVPIIAQTGFAMDEDRIKCLDAGCSDFIAKPIMKENLYKLIHKYLD